MSMKLKSVQVKNFKCVEDSTEFEICPVTCLVGKNEAGKTSLLEALYKLNPDVEEFGEFDVLLEYPRRRRKEYEQSQRAREAEPNDALITKWDLEDEDMELLGTLLGTDAVKSRSVTIRKGYYPGSKCKLDVEALLPTFVYFSKFLVMNGRVSIDDIIEKKQEGRLSGSERIFLALLNLVGTTPEKVRDVSSSEELIADLEAASAPITDKISYYWSQNRNLRVSFLVHPGKAQDPPPFDKGLVFETRILNTQHNVTLNVNERSTGFGWFFSFLVWFSQVRKIYGDNLVILLDDPGFGLHAKAQEDLLTYISEELEPHYQVIYTTHSPFMIDARKLRRARTVEGVVEVTHDGREINRGTKVGDRILSSDANTLAPLKAAIGFEITQTLFSGKKVLLVERPSDLLYLKWFSERLAQRGRIALDSDWTIAPCGEIQKMCALLSLMGEGRANVAMLIDGAVGRKENPLSQDDSDLLRDCRVFTADMYVDVNGGSVEDLMGRRAYFSLVNSQYKLPRKFELREGGLIAPSIPVVMEVEDYLRSLPSGGVELNRYALAEHLVENGKKLVKKLRDLEEGLDRFERFFADLNECLSGEPIRLTSPGMDKYAQSNGSNVVETKSRNASRTETYAVQR
jgi:predicted ATPase